MGMDRCIVIGLLCYYFALTTCFTVLYSVFYYNIVSDPGYAEISINQKTPLQLRNMLYITYGFLVVYYIYYLIMLCKNLRMIMDLERASIAIFCFS